MYDNWKKNLAEYVSFLYLLFVTCYIIDRQNQLSIIIKILNKMSLGYFSTQHIISSNMLFNIRNESMKNMEIYISSFCLIWSALYIHSLETYYNISLVNSKQKCRTTKKRMRKVNDNVYYSLCCLVAAVYIRI